MLIPTLSQESFKCIKTLLFQQRRRTILATQMHQKRICNYAPADSIRSINRQIASLQRQIKISQNKDLTASVPALKEKNYLYNR